MVFEKQPSHLLTIKERHLARQMFCWNATLWGLGNGLVSTSLIIYIVQTLAEGMMSRAMMGVAISWVIAAPRLIGVLRILTPSLIDGLGSRKWLCFFGYFFSPLILLLLPTLMPFYLAVDPLFINVVLCVVGLIWAVYHLVEYFATIALWAWLGDLLSPCIRTRFIAKRERWMIAGQFIGMLTAGLYTWLLHPLVTTTRERLDNYTTPAWWGIAFLLMAAFPLLAIREIAWQRAETLGKRLAELGQPFGSVLFLPFLLFGCWIQLANGLTQTPQSVFLIYVLGVSMLVNLLLQSGTRLGQMGMTRMVARFIDHWGNYRVIALSLLVVSSGQLCYLYATPTCWYPIIGAAVIWCCWVGVNIGIQNLTIILAPASQRTSYIALYYTLTTLTFGLATLAGGTLFDWFKTTRVLLPFVGMEVGYYEIAFVSGWVLRSAGVLFLLWGWSLSRRYLIEQSTHTKEF